MRDTANVVDDVSVNKYGEYYYEKHDKFDPDLVRDMLRQLADIRERLDKSVNDPNGIGSKEYDYILYGNA